MKNLYVTLVATMLLLLAVSCKKETAAPQENAQPSGQQEAVADEPITPLDKIIPLPAGGHASARTASGERIPIIMVHGLGGIGPDDMLGLYHYWGGIDDIPKYLTANGYPAFAAKVGPVSSNYDRAVELYYYIKGGYVDYGKFHSAKYGHAQKKAKYYPGIYPQWDAQHPVHLLGHSMGGITVRKLVTLLEKGDALEQQDPAHAGLFNGDKTGWVKSVTSISTPHNGATLSYILLSGYIPFVRQFITAAAALAGGFSGVDNIYDFSLEQWGLERQPGESFGSYANRVAANSALATTEDYSGHDVTPEALLDPAKKDPDSKSVYYFSFTTKASMRGLLTGWEYPRLDMFPILMPVAYPTPILMGIGNYTRKQPGKIIIDSKWWPNDGAANTYGMSGPEGSIIREYNAARALEKGVWNHMGVYNGYDHFDIIGIGYLPSVRPFYSNIAKLLAGIE
ncbi:lipase [Chitinophaga agrisoli]|uniref:triacylglycerol lipase n=1 Tax=Chitinophaga agrisoli TaxID=2607653 RepID=A0A5B2VJF9_9BACT|nr:lipase [Chitinophaga agrisoli]KAA2238502.1 lipase [Chitinophaga agrisoli]